MFLTHITHSLGAWWCGSVLLCSAHLRLSLSIRGDVCAWVDKRTCMRNIYTNMAYTCGAPSKRRLAAWMTNTPHLFHTLFFLFFLGPLHSRLSLTVLCICMYTSSCYSINNVHNIQTKGLSTFLALENFHHHKGFPCQISPLCFPLHHSFCGFSIITPRMFALPIVTHTQTHTIVFQT